MAVKRLIPFLLSFLLCAIFLFTSCDTSVFGSSRTYVTNMPEPTENDRYLIWSGRLTTVLVDKETGTVFPLCYQKNTQIAPNVPAEYRYTVKYVFLESAIEWHTHLAVPKYDPDTGYVSHYLYYPTVICFDYTGTEIRRDESEAPLSETEVEALVSGGSKADPSFFSYAKEIGSDRPSDGTEEHMPTYTAHQQKAVDYALSLEDKIRGEYHMTWGQGFERDGKVYFSVIRSNRKDWASQTATVQGIYHSMILCYDPEADTFETLFSSDKTQEILLFDTTHVLVLSGDTLRSYAFETGKSVKVYKLKKDAYYSFESSAGLLHLTRSETIKGVPPEYRGYVSFSYPCDLHAFITPDGKILAEDYDLTPNEKEDVREGHGITYQGW